MHLVSYSCKNQKTKILNKQIILNQRPIGAPTAETWTLRESEIPSIKEGEFLCEIEYISLDPAMRGWVSDAKSYLPPVQIGEVMRAGSIGKVIESNHEGYSVGDVVTGWMGVQQYAVSDGKNGAIKINPFGLPLPKFLGTLGMPGLTAYFGLLRVGLPKEGETVVVSGAAGAVGMVVGQIAKIKGCRVVGIAGGPEKCQYVVDELGFDACIDYKNENIYKALKANCPDGVDLYFDNVGGEILDAVLSRINMKARIAICGAISQYNSTEVKGPKNYLALLVNRARMEGLIVLDYAKDYSKAIAEMAQWMQEGKLKSREHVEEGIENFFPTFNRLFSGDKKGKLVLKVK